MWEFTREEQFIGATTRHQMTTRVKLGAKRDGTLTAIQVRVVSNTGAYGGHGGETLAAALGEPDRRLPLRQQEGRWLRGLHQHVPAAGFRGYGASQTTFAIECAMDDLARLLGMGPFEIRRKNMIAPRRLDRVDLDGDLRHRVRQLWARPVPRSRRDGARQRPRSLQTSGRGLAEGHGHRAVDAGNRAAHGASVGRRDAALRPTAATIWPSARPRWATARRPRTASSPPACSARARAASPSSMATPISRPYDTGTFASTGTVVAGQAVELTAAALRDNIIDFASRHARLRAGRLPGGGRCDHLRQTGGSRSPISMPPAPKRGTSLRGQRKAYLSPRSIGFNVHGVRVAVNRITGEIRSCRACTRPTSAG